MGIISRFLLLLYSLVVGTVVVIIAGACLDIMPSKFWQPSLNFILARPETLGVLAVMLLLSFFFLTRVFVPTENPEVAEDEISLQNGQVGDIKVAVDAIERIAERAALSVTGVREAQAVVLKNKRNAQIFVRLNIVLAQGYSAPVVSENAVESIDTAILVALQIPNVPVEVKIRDITNAVAERRQRVI